MRFTYAYGYRTRDAALEALEDSLANGDVTMGEGPEVSSYRTHEGALRWRITLPA